MSPQVAVDYSSKIMGRYTDAYRFSRVIVGAGSLVKNLGFIVFAVALLPLVLTLILNSESIAQNTLRNFGYAIPIEPFRIIACLMALGGGILWVFMWFLGVVISAQGQLLKATVDQSVNTSPFLADSQRAKVMSLT